MAGKTLIFGILSVATLPISFQLFSPHHLPKTQLAWALDFQEIVIGMVTLTLQIDAFPPMPS